MPPLADDAPPFAGTLTQDVTDARGPGILQNSVFIIGGLIAASLVGALSGVITVRTLGQEQYGVLAVVFGLIEFGRGLTNFTHNPSILAVHRGQDEGAVFGTSLWLKFLGAFLCVGLAVVFADMLGDTFNVPPAAIVLTSTLLLVGAFQEIGTARYEAANQMLLRTVFVSLGPFVGLLAVLVFLAAGAYDVMTAILTSIIGTGAMSLAFFLHWRKRRFRWDGGIAKYLVHYGGRLVAASFLTQALLWTDTLMVSYLLGNAEAGLYHIVFQLAYVVVTASVAIGIAVLPAMSELVGKGQDTSAAYHRGTLLASALAVASAIVFAIAGPFILYGVYDLPLFEGYRTLLILTVFGAAASLLVPVVSLLTVHHHAGKLTLLSLAQAVVNVPLCYALTLRFGIEGAAIATTSVFVVGLLVTWWLAHRVTGAWPFSAQATREAWGLARERIRRWGRRLPR